LGVSMDSSARRATRLTMDRHFRRVSLAFGVASAVAAAGGNGRASLSLVPSGTAAAPNHSAAAPVNSLPVISAASRRSSIMPGRGYRPSFGGRASMLGLPLLPINEMPSNQAPLPAAAPAPAPASASASLLPLRPSLDPAVAPFASSSTAMRPSFGGLGFGVALPGLAAAAGAVVGRTSIFVPSTLGAIREGSDGGSGRVAATSGVGAAASRVRSSLLPIPASAAVSKATPPPLVAVSQAIAEEAAGSSASDVSFDDAVMVDATDAAAPLATAAATGVVEAAPVVWDGALSTLSTESAVDVVGPLVPEPETAPINSPGANTAASSVVLVASTSPSSEPAPAPDLAERAVTAGLATILSFLPSADLLHRTPAVCSLWARASATAYSWRVACVMVPPPPPSADETSSGSTGSGMR
jgi:hypothetical protein